MMITILTCTRNSVHDTGRMPSTNTSDLSQTSVSLAGQLLNTESLDNSDETVATSNTDSVATLIVLEDLAELDLLLEAAVGEFDLLGNIATVDLNLQNVGLVLTELEQTHLGGNENAHDTAVLLDAFKITLD